MIVENSGRELWYRDSHVAVRVSRTDNEDRLSVLEFTMPHGEAPPFHLHRDEDEVFHILEGTLLVQANEQRQLVGPGETVLMKRGVPHGFRVASREGARVLVITRGPFEGMVRAVARPAGHSALPEPSELTAELRARMAEQCELHGIELLGPPID